MDKIYQRFTGDIICGGKSLNEALRLHTLWLGSGGEEGERADLSWADLSGADLAGTSLEDAKITSTTTIDYQIQDGLLLEVAKIVTEDNSKLNIDNWHTCKTTHCLAGWACHLNPVARELEKTHGAEVAGLLTLGWEAHSYFFTDNSTVLEWLRGFLEVEEEKNYG